MKIRTVLFGLMALAAVAAIALLVFPGNKPAWGDDPNRSTAFTIQVGLSEPGYADAIATCSSVAPEDARVTCEIRYIPAGESTEHVTSRSQGKRVAGLVHCEMGVAVDEYPGCTLRAYWTAFDGSGAVTWAFMRSLQLP